jgi:capsular polysaccharide biosynthesis protein
MELRSYLARVWKYAFIIIIGVAGAATIAFMISSRGENVYTADARVVVTAGLGTEGNGSVSVEVAPLVAQSYAVLATTRPVLLDVIRQADLPYDPAEVLRGLSVVASLDNPYIVISMTDADPRRAATTANAVADIIVGLSSVAPAQRPVGSPDEELLAVVERATVPTDPSGPRVLYNTLLAAGAALVVALAILAIGAYVRREPITA